MNFRGIETSPPEREQITRAVLESQKKLQALKSALRKEQEAVDLVWKEYIQYFDSADQQGPLQWMLKLQSMCKTFKVDELDEPDGYFEIIDNEDNDDWLHVLDEWLVLERNAATNGIVIIPSAGARAKCVDWAFSDLILLIKAVKIYPRRAKQRWESVAQFVNARTANQRSVKEVKTKAKSMRFLKKRKFRKFKYLASCVKAEAKDEVPAAAGWTYRSGKNKGVKTKRKLKKRAKILPDE